MAAVGRRALTLKSLDLTATERRYRLARGVLQLSGVPDVVLLLFVDQIEVQACGCWHWGGLQDPERYGRFMPGKAWSGSSNAAVHRFTWALANGRVPPRDMVVDHLCPNRACCFPGHLQLVPFADNVRLGSTRPHAGRSCSSGDCVGGVSLPRSTEVPTDTGLEQALARVRALRGRLTKAVGDERKLLSFAAHYEMTPAPPGVGLVGPCWEWSGARTDHYPKLTWKQVKGETRMSHRWSYEHFVGAVPPGLQVDHRCNRRWCVNPDHLQPLTGRANSARALTGASTLNSAKTHCHRGHPFDEVNTRWVTRGENRTRQCLTCTRERDRKQAREARERREKGVKLREEGFCPNGHEYTADNTRVTPQGRKCRACVAASAQRYRRRQEENGTASRHPRRQD